MLECGTPKTMIGAMEFPMLTIKKFWEEGSRDEWAAQAMKFMLAGWTRMAGGEGGSVIEEFDGVVTWGWKPE